MIDVMLRSPDLFVRSCRSWGVVVASLGGCENQSLSCALEDRGLPRNVWTVFATLGGR